MKKISSRMTKAILLTMLFLVQAVASSAQVKLYMEDFTISNGETKEVALLLDNDKAATALQAKIELPKGLLYVDGSVAKTSRVKGRGASVQASTMTGQLVIVETGGTIDAGEGAVITFQVEREGASDGEEVLSISEMVVSDAGANQLNTEEEQEVKVQFIGLGDCSFSAPEAISIAAGQECQVDVSLTNAGVNNLAAVQGTLVLPAGLEIVPGEDGKFIYSDRTPAPMEFQYKDFEGYTSFILSSSDNTTIIGTEGVLFSFKVKATESLAENSDIVLSSLRVAAKTGQSAETNDVKIQVTNTSVSDKTAFDAYKVDKSADVEAMAKEGDSDVSKKLIADAKAAVEAMTFDYGKTLDEQKAEIDAVVEELTAALEAQRGAEATEAAAVVAANEKLAELKTAAEALVVSEETKVYENDNVKAAVAAAEEAIAAVAPVIQALEAKIAEGNLSTENKEALAAAEAATQEAIEKAAAAIADAQETYKNQKQLDDAAEAGAKASAEASVTNLKIAMQDVVVSEDDKASVNQKVQAAVAAAEEAIAAANNAIADVEAIIAEGKLATDNKVAVAQAINAAQKAVDKAQAAIDAIAASVVPIDVNDDGEVDITDVQTVVKAVNEGSTETVLYDINGDGEIDITDVIMIISIINNQ